MKEENINLVKMGYLEKENKYYATFQVSNIHEDKRQRILKRQKEEDFFQLNDRDCEVFGVGNELYLTDYFQPEEFKDYNSLIKLAKKGIIPERINPITLEREIDMCTLEQDAYFTIKYSGFTIEEIKEHYNILDKTLDHIKQKNESVMSMTTPREIARGVSK